MNASPSNHTLLDNIQKKALKIIGTNEATACAQSAITSVFHRWGVVATTLLYKMHTINCPADLISMLPPPYEMRRITRNSLSMPNHALFPPVSVRPLWTEAFCTPRSGCGTTCLILLSLSSLHKHLLTFGVTQLLL